MRKVLCNTMGVVVFLALAVIAVWAEDVPFSGFMGSSDVYNQLQPGPEGGAKHRWLKPGADFAKYNKFMVDSVVFFFANNSDYKGIDPQEMKDLSDEFNKNIVAAFKDKYPIVAEPGPDVARIRIAVTNIKPSNPGVSTVTSILPVGLGVSLMKKGASGGWSGGGETGVEMMILDSDTNQVIAMAADQQSAAFSDRFSKWDSAAQAFKLWSERIVLFMDNIKGVKK